MNDDARTLGRTSLVSINHIFNLGRYHFDVAISNHVVGEIKQQETKRKYVRESAHKENAMPLPLPLPVAAAYFCQNEPREILTLE